MHHDVTITGIVIEAVLETIHTHAGTIEFGTVIGLGSFEQSDVGLFGFTGVAQTTFINLAIMIFVRVFAMADLLVVEEFARLDIHHPKPFFAAGKLKIDNGEYTTFRFFVVKGGLVGLDTFFEDLFP